MTTFTLVHVSLSLAAIASGLVVVFGLITAKMLDRWTVLFLVTAAATSVTGFLFPYHKLTPGIIIGIVSVVTLAFAILARYVRHLVGPWRWIYAVNIVISLYLNVLVLIAQLFQKVPALKAVAPTQSEPSFVVSQLVALALFALLGVYAVRRFRVESTPAVAVFS